VHGGQPSHTTALRRCFFDAGHRTTHSHYLRPFGFLNRHSSNGGNQWTKPLGSTAFPPSFSNQPPPWSSDRNVSPSGTSAKRLTIEAIAAQPFRIHEGPALLGRAGGDEAPDLAGLIGGNRVLRLPRDRQDGIAVLVQKRKKASPQKKSTSMVRNETFFFSPFFRTSGHF
jgi:hypothetical protein